MIDWLLQTAPAEAGTFLGVPLLWWAALGGIATALGVAGTAVAKGGPPVIAWIRRRYFPQFWIMVLEPVTYELKSGKVMVAFRTLRPVGYYTMEWGVTIGGQSQRGVEEVPMFNGRTGLHEVYAPYWIELPPGITSTTADVTVVMRRVRGMFLFRGAARAGSMRVRVATNDR